MLLVINQRDQHDAMYTGHRLRDGVLDYVERPGASGVGATNSDVSVDAADAPHPHGPVKRKRDVVPPLDETKQQVDMTITQLFRRVADEWKPCDKLPSVALDVAPTRVALATVAKQFEQWWDLHRVVSHGSRDPAKRIRADAVTQDTDVMMNMITNDVERTETWFGSRFVLPANSAFCMTDIWQAAPAIRLLETQFTGIVIDPPWPNKSVARAKTYACMSMDSIGRLASLPVHDWLHPAGLVCVWITNNPECHRIVTDVLFPAWRCEIVATWYWLKVTPKGLPVSPLASTHKLPFERILVGRRPPQKLSSFGLPFAAIASVPLAHSVKPSLEPLILRALQSPAPDEPQSTTAAGPFLELFARRLCPHWVSVGQQPLLFQDAAMYSAAAPSAAPADKEDTIAAAGCT